MLARTRGCRKECMKEWGSPGMNLASLAQTSSPSSSSHLFPPVPPATFLKAPASVPGTLAYVLWETTPPHVSSPVPTFANTQVQQSH